MSDATIHLHAQPYQTALSTFDEQLGEALAPIMSGSLRETVRLVGEELLTNVIRHGYGGQDGMVEIEITIDQAGVGLIMRDRAAPFDPLAWDPGDDPLEEGKRGILLVRRLTDWFSWQRTREGWNEVYCHIPVPTAGTAPGGDPLERPRLREDVEFHPLGSGSVLVGSRAIDRFVIDAGTAALLGDCDGRPLPVIVAALNARCDTSFTEADVRLILQSLLPFGYLDGVEGRSRRLVRGDPQRLLGLLRPLSRLYGKRWVAGSAIGLAVFGLGMTVWQGTALIEAYGRLVRLHPVGGPLLGITGWYLGYSVLAVGHELGHALAVYRLGGAVPEIGLRSNLNFFVLSDRAVLEHPADRVWYFAGGLLSDVFWWAVLWIWWLAAPGPVPLLLLAPQTVYMLVYAWAPSGRSDAALVLRELVGWEPLPRPGREPGWMVAWRRARPAQRLLEVSRSTLAAALLVFVAIRDPLLFAIYLVYRLLRRLLSRPVD